MVYTNGIMKDIEIEPYNNFGDNGDEASVFPSLSKFKKKMGCFGKST